MSFTPVLAGMDFEGVRTVSTERRVPSGKTRTGHACAAAVVKLISKLVCFETRRLGAAKPDSIRVIHRACFKSKHRSILANGRASGTCDIEYHYHEIQR